MDLSLAGQGVLFISLPLGDLCKDFQTGQNVREKDRDHNVQDGRMDLLIQSCLLTRVATVLSKR